METNWIAIPMICILCELGIMCRIKMVKYSMYWNKGEVCALISSPQIHCFKNCIQFQFFAFQCQMVCVISFAFISLLLFTFYFHYHLECPLDRKWWGGRERGYLKPRGLNSRIILCIYVRIICSENARHISQKILYMWSGKLL